MRDTDAPHAATTHPTQQHGTASVFPRRLGPRHSRLSPSTPSVLQSSPSFSPSAASAHQPFQSFSHLSTLATSALQLPQPSSHLNPSAASALQSPQTPSLLGPGNHRLSDPVFKYSARYNIVGAASSFHKFFFFLLFAPRLGLYNSVYR